MKAILALLAVASLQAASAGAADLDLGKKLFTAKCATCHGRDGKGVPSMAKMFKVPVERMNYTSETNLKKTDAELTQTIVKGNGKMPSFKGKLKDDEIGALVGYVRSIQGVKQAGDASAPAANQKEAKAADPAPAQ